MDVKNKLYNFETTPPDGVWANIATVLNNNEARVIPINKKKNNTIYYMAAASIALILFCFIFFNNRSSKSANEKLITTSNSKTQNQSALNNNVIITVPTEERITSKNNTGFDGSTAPSVLKSKNTQKKDKEVINKNDLTDKKFIAVNTTQRYITVEGPQGQPVKVSSKMATLIDSAETKMSSKPIWNKKINEWREIMKANTLAPTPGNFLDIVELTKSLKDNK